MGPQAARSKSRFEAGTFGEERNDSCMLEFFAVTKVHEEGHEGPVRAGRRRRSRAFKFPASSASLRNELSSWSKLSAQLHENGREFSVCEFHRLGPGGKSAWESAFVRRATCREAKRSGGWSGRSGERPVDFAPDRGEADPQRVRDLPVGIAGGDEVRTGLLAPDALRPARLRPDPPTRGRRLAGL